jgi:hypothetical protein
MSPSNQRARDMTSRSMPNRWIEPLFFGALPRASPHPQPLLPSGEKGNASAHHFLLSASVRSRPFFTMVMNSSIWALVQVRDGEISMVSRVARSISPFLMQ